MLVCEGAGFIGSNFVRQRLEQHGDDVVVLDKLTYAGRRENFARLDAELVMAGIEDAEAVRGALAGVGAVVNFASPPRRTSTARSPSPTRLCRPTPSAPESSSRPSARPASATSGSAPDGRGLRLHRGGSFTEESPLQPSSPYSATKAGADLLVASYFHTSGTEGIIWWEPIRSDDDLEYYAPHNGKSPV